MKKILISLIFILNLTSCVNEKKNFEINNLIGEKINSYHSVSYTNKQKLFLPGNNKQNIQIIKEYFQSQKNKPTKLVVKCLNIKNKECLELKKIASNVAKNYQTENSNILGIEAEYEFKHLTKNEINNNAVGSVTARNMNYMQE